MDPRLGQPRPTDLRAHAEELLATNRYLTLGTVTPDGRPWTSPVYFAADGLTSYYWCSTVDSQNALWNSSRVSVTPRKCSWSGAFS